jgi:hypothetical protein
LSFSFNFLRLASFAWLLRPGNHGGGSGGSGGRVSLSPLFKKLSKNPLDKSS